MEHLTLRIDDGLARLVLSRSASYNALSLSLIRELLGVLKELAGRRDVGVIVIEGAGRGFSAGHDLREILEHEGPQEHHALFATCSEMMLLIEKMPQPVIAKVHGVATAAGCQLVASCDLAYAARSARFGTPGVNIGLFCSTPMVPLSRTVSRKHAMEMLLTGNLISAERASEIGLINGVFPEEELEEHVVTVARTILSKSPLAVSTGKGAFYAQRTLSTEEAYGFCTDVMIKSLQSHDAREGISAFLEKRPAKFTGK